MKNHKMNLSEVILQIVVLLVLHLNGYSQNVYQDFSLKKYNSDNYDSLLKVHALKSPINLIELANLHLLNYHDDSSKYYFSLSTKSEDFGTRALGFLGLAEYYLSQGKIANAKKKSITVRKVKEWLF